ncbi:MAG: L,D-transpeptidase [Paracoccaceae bacterium]
MFSLVLSAALIGSLSACVPDPALVEAGLAKPPEPKVVEGVYASAKDGTFDVPAVPVEKVPAEFQRQTVYYPTDQAPGTIIINPAAKHLYLITGKNTATRYGISVGRAGFEWSGEALITERKSWPTWTPPKEMIERKPELAKWEKGQPGGTENPLGARALYLTTNGVDYGYRIHGTPEWFSIGKSASSGCIRMINQDVMDLYNRVPDGSKVIVLTATGEMPKGLTLPPPAPVKKKVAAKPAVAAPAAPVEPVMPALPAPPPLDAELVVDQPV